MTARILNTFDPIRFPIEMAFSLLRIAIIEADNSGMLVPTETIEILMMRSLTPIAVARETADLIRTSEPSHKKNTPAANNMRSLL